MFYGVFCICVNVDKFPDHAMDWSSFVKSCDVTLWQKLARSEKLHYKWNKKPQRAKTSFTETREKNLTSSRISITLFVSLSTNKLSAYISTNEKNFSHWFHEWVMQLMPNRFSGGLIFSSTHWANLPSSRMHSENKNWKNLVLIA